ncbi:CAP-associated domain-containing protein [Ureibacillus chungkukjangi]|uniref:CAP domain-containing protein n=1 Tax=Ureibacillus chungkukjangi TaxID=1202712 RepID=UPI002040EA35|nr:CAP-associated domain-containing protein [Ureibacillus chungkukjangi]MCM3386638.1 CAP-associated domain-containing protein [Ureibacillus chungkukjangi]
MKTLFRILIVLSFLAIIFFYSSSSDNYQPLEGPNSTSQIIPKTSSNQEISQDSLPRPEEGLSTLIGKSSDELIKLYKEPARTDKSAYGYDWWIYNQIPTQFMMFAVANGVVTQVYTNANESDISPYKMGQTLEDIYSMTIIESELNATIENNIYSFTMSEDDMNTRILTKFGDIFAQLYIDSETGMLSGIRFMDSRTLVIHRPYEMSFVGKLLSPPSPTSYLIEESNKANATIIYDLLNVFRVNNNLPIISEEATLTSVAMEHSEEMYTESYLSHESPTKGSLKERLDSEGIQFKNAEENIATSYIDSIEAVHGWLNSSTHRKYMLDEAYTQVGSGTFMNYYTQIFVEEEKNEIEE